MPKINFVGAISCITCGTVEATTSDTQKKQYFQNYTALREAATIPPVLKEGLCQKCRDYEQTKSAGHRRKSSKNRVTPRVASHN